MTAGVAEADRKLPSLSKRSYLEGAKHLLRENPALGIGTILVTCTFILAIIGPSIAPYDPIEHDYYAAVQAPSSAHLLGTDKFGRDQLSRILHGAQIDLSIGIICTFVPFILGVLLGCISGYYGGMIDTLLMRLGDIQTAFPFYVLLIAILAVLGPGIINMYYALILVEWITFARLVRGEVLVAKNMDYVLAARALGYSDFHIILRELLPNIIAQALIYAMSDVPLCILAGASLGFVGLGVKPPNPEWGVMIAESREYLATAWWLPVFPGLAIAFVGLSFSFLGDGLASLLRPTDR
jgi:peptide/nickel transport system permease protein